MNLARFETTSTSSTNTQPNNQIGQMIGQSHARTEWMLFTPGLPEHQGIPCSEFLVSEIPNKEFLDFQAILE